MTVVDDFKIRYPEFDECIVDDRIPILLNDVPLYFNRPYTNARNQPIILTLLAHLLVVDQEPAVGGGASSGVVTSKSAGSVSVTFAARNDKSAMWDIFGSTKYGQAFIQMTSFIIGAKFV